MDPERMESEDAVRCAARARTIAPPLPTDAEGRLVVAKATVYEFREEEKPEGGTWAEWLSSGGVEDLADIAPRAGEEMETRAAEEPGARVVLPAHSLRPPQGKGRTDGARAPIRDARCPVPKRG
jgi:hypothetical protein